MRNMRKSITPGVGPVDATWQPSSPRDGVLARPSMTQYVEPIHRWCAFSDSWPPSAVGQIISSLKIDNDDWIWDPFAGCGTTAVVAKSRGICSISSEIDPLAVLVAHMKTHPPCKRVLESCIWPEALGLAQLFGQVTEHLNSSRSVGIRTMRFLIAASLIRSRWHLGDEYNDQFVRAEFSKLRNEMLDDRCLRRRTPKRSSIPAIFWRKSVAFAS